VSFFIFAAVLTANFPEVSIQLFKNEGSACRYGAANLEIKEIKPKIVMAGLDPAIHAFPRTTAQGARRGCPEQVRA
jgi:hypothetical protein